ncbi:hypothetical protein EXIGLDRAFT_764202 [Exidia glandulosa HHB12029]|uniref:Uncharacterized protein n=1 Tax=Exidia glandulosa HHB12029 TaxID=1314781 RepID=A0A165LCW6_EXIGL|nr:hypothetical protein EXIGLDRAFT_764202 [Exidia glandulosa HHB12029]
MSTPTPVHDFPVNERVGLGFVVAAAALSTLAPFGLIIHLIYSARKTQGAQQYPPAPSSRARYFRSHLHYYFISLLFSDMVQGLGGFLDLKWVTQGHVTGGAYCTAQGALKQVGDVGVALSILAITVHTFAVLFFHWTPPESHKIPIIVLALDWLFIVLVVSIAYGLHGRRYYGITGLWCWITALYPVERIMLEYFWLWATALVNVVLYVPLFFALRGNIVVSHPATYGGWPRVSFSATTPGAPWAVQRDAKQHLRMALLMLCYPAIYLITILPTSIARFLAFGGHNVADVATIVCGLLFSSSGIFNVILFTTTRPMLLPHAPQQPHQLTTMMSFRHTGHETASTEPFEPSASTATMRTGMGIADPQAEKDLFPQYKSRSTREPERGDDTESIRSSLKAGSITGDRL